MPSRCFSWSALKKCNRQRLKLGETSNQVLAPMPLRYFLTSYVGSEKRRVLIPHRDVDMRSI